MVVILFGIMLEIQILFAIRFAPARSVTAVAWVAVHGMGDTIDHFGGFDAGNACEKTRRYAPKSPASILSWLI